jgi:hypothetical protein
MTIHRFIDHMIAAMPSKPTASSATSGQDVASARSIGSEFIFVSFVIGLCLFAN